jgi:hypothetical protein
LKIPTKKLLLSTGLAILIFFSISFVTVLFQTNSPLNRKEDYNLFIGFPFEYYLEFAVECDAPNTGWKLNNLLADIIITWTLTTGAYFLLTKNRE